MITSIESKEIYNNEGKCWDTVITWNYNGVANKVIAGYKSDIAINTLIALVEAQCNNKIKTTILNI